MQSWVDQVVEPGQFGGIRARHLHQGLGKLSGAFQRGAALASLDLAKCFDYVHPELAARVLAEAGFPGILLAAMSHTWAQERFMELGGYVLRDPQYVSSAIICPKSNLILRVGALGPIKQTIVKKELKMRLTSKHNCSIQHLPTLWTVTSL